MTGKLILKANGEERDITSDLFEDDDAETAAGRLYKHGRYLEVRGVSISISRILNDIQIEIGINPMPENIKVLKDLTDVQV